MIFFAGIIRGALAFALSTQIVSDNGDYLRATCLEVVVFTIVVLGGVMALFAHLVGIKPPEEKQPIGAAGYEAINDEESVAETESDREHRVSRFHLCWRKLDENYMKRIFGGKMRRQETLDERLLKESLQRDRKKGADAAEEQEVPLQDK